MEVNRVEPLSDLKAILHSKRANIYYLEKCRIMVKDGRVVYLTEEKNGFSYWNIPIANTTVIMLGTGTSVTQAAVRMLASAGVLLGFCGGGGTPLFAGAEVEWISPLSEYRPTEYVQKWFSFWFDDEKRLEIAKRFQKNRIKYLSTVYSKDRDLQNEQFYADDREIEVLQNEYSKKIDSASSVSDLLAIEAMITKNLYAYAARKTGITGFSREHDNPSDAANIFLNHGNYLAYGLAASTLWVLGIPHGFAVMHGKTRRGALVFDVADLVKDALVLPWAFICSKRGYSEQEFRDACLQAFTKHNAMDFMFEQIKQACSSVKELET